MRVTYHVLNDSVVLGFDGQFMPISKDDARYEKVIEAIRNDELDTIPDIVDLEKGLREKGLDIQDGIVHVQGEPMPHQLSDRILQYRDENLPFDSLLKFWENLKQNPSFNARQMLYNFLEHNGHPLTNDGCFIAYRGVRDDFRDCHSGRFDNSPGKVCEMPRENVDDNPNNTCSNGLHVACHSYAVDFGKRLIEVKVNPRDVVAVPTDYNGTKMRVCRFEVIQECGGMRTEALYTDDSSAEDDEQSCPGCGMSYEDMADQGGLCPCDED